MSLCSAPLPDGTLCQCRACAEVICEGLRVPLCAEHHSEWCREMADDPIPVRDADAGRISGDAQDRDDRR